MDDQQPQIEPITYEPRKHWLAGFSFWCGIVGVCCIPGFYDHVYNFIILPIIPIVIFGFIAGAVNLVICYWPASSFVSVKQAWIGCLLCVITFIVAGLCVASELNYAICITDQRNIAERVLLDAQDNGGRLPTSLDAVDMPPVCRYCHKYYFYSLHTTSLYIMNGYLAGKNIHDFAFPEQTLLTAVGKDMHTKLFSKESDMDLSNNRAVTFLDGMNMRIALGNLPSHFPVDGKVTKDSWFIKPQYLHK